MDNISDTVDDKSVHEERSDGADSPDREPKYENSGEAKEQLYSEVQVHASAEGERSSPDYMDTRDGKERSCSSSSSSSDDEGAKAEEVAERKVEVEQEPVAEVNGDAHDGSRRSSASSASSASPRDPCDDPPIQPRIHDDDNAEDGMLMAYAHPTADIKPEEPVEYGLKTLENVTLDESSAAPADPSQPDISLYVKVRNTYCTGQHEDQAAYAGKASVSLSLTVHQTTQLYLSFNLH